MEKSTILTPYGRLVAGSPFDANDKNFEGDPLTVKKGPNAGQPRVEYFSAIAIPKNDPGWPALHAQILEAAKLGHPTLFDATGACVLPTFAFKITDGDSQVPNKKGNKPCDKEGYAGHWILGFSSGFAPKCYADRGETLLTDPTSIKRGYYIQISGSVVGNGNPTNPGVYLNYDKVLLVGFGAEIASGLSGTEVFGSAPVGTLPAGASATPLAQAATATPPALPPAQGVQPATDFLTPPPPAQAAPALPHAPTHVMLPPAGGATYEAMIAAGWTDETLRANGMMQ